MYQCTHQGLHRYWASKDYEDVAKIRHLFQILTVAPDCAYSCRLCHRRTHEWTLGLRKLCVCCQNPPPESCGLSANPADRRQVATMSMNMRQCRLGERKLHEQTDELTCMYSWASREFLRWDVLQRAVLRTENLTAAHLHKTEILILHEDPDCSFLVVLIFFFFLPRTVRML